MNRHSISPIVFLIYLWGGKKISLQHWQFHQSIFDLQLACKCLDTLFSRCITIHNRGLLRETAESLTCTLLNPCNPELEAASIAKISCREWGEAGILCHWCGSWLSGKPWLCVWSPLFQICPSTSSDLYSLPKCFSISISYNNNEL